jgi:hypothetical protein
VYTSSSCTACEAGKYKEGVGTADCVSCPPNSTTALTASTGVSDCKCEASYGTASANADGCQLCAAGKYRGGIAIEECDTCGQDTYIGSEAAKCESCPSGSAAEAGSNAITKCICKAGYFGPDGGTCEAGIAGKYKPGPGAEECKDCAADSSSPTASTTCRCNAGYTGPDGAQCTPCVAGTYKDTEGSVSCVKCADYAEAPAGKSSCTCKDGFEGPRNGPCAATQSNTATQQPSAVVVSIVVGLEISKDALDESKQTAFRTSIANAAGVALDDDLGVACAGRALCSTCFTVIAFLVFDAFQR